MSIASVEIALDLDPDCSPGHLDGKLRITIEDDMVSFHCDKERSGYAYILASCSKADLQRALGFLEDGA